MRMEKQIHTDTETHNLHEVKNQCEQEVQNATVKHIKYVYTW